METNINIPLFDLKAQDLSIRKEILSSIETIIQNASYIKGPILEIFEQDFAQFTGTKYAVGVASGTDALHLSLHALGITSGDEVILPVNTFVATAYAVLYVGAKPVFVDIDSQTYNINPELIEKNITKRTKAIIPVHLYGNPADMDRVNTIARKHNIYVLEDAAQSHGAIYKKKRTGSLGDIAAFSFYPNKNLGAYGDGGAITTDSKKLAEKLKKIREYGASKKYIFDEIGFNSRLDTIQAQILQIKLKHLDAITKKKREKAAYYTKNLHKYSPFIKTPYIQQDSMHAYHLYTISVPKRDQLMKYLADNKIQTGIYYPLPLHQQKSLHNLGYKKRDFPITESLSKEILSLPIYPELQKKQQDYIIEHIASFFNK